MPPALRVRRFARQTLPILLVLSAAGGCYKLDDDDCKLSNTCSSERLFESYGEQVSADCETCMRESCDPQARACSTDFRCSRTVDCMLAYGPHLYQECLTELWEDGISTPEDKEGAWEGDAHLFRECLDDCQSQCKRDESDWMCVGDWNEGKRDVDLTARIAVRIYHNPTSISHVAAPGVLVKPCTPGRECSGEGGRETDAAGVVRLALGPVDVDAVYFAVTKGSSGLEFPNTFFYPVRLSSDPEQPIAIYLVSTEAVKIGNNTLRMLAGGTLNDETGLLDDAAQSVILPDACREQEKPSSIGATFQVLLEGKLLPRCVDAMAGDSQTVVPCLWYGYESNGFPIKDQTETRGWGGGVFGLPVGEHEVRVCDGENLVASRWLRMQPGWLTMARTWPFSRSKKPSEDKCSSLQAHPSVGSGGPAN